MSVFNFNFEFVSGVINLIPAGRIDSTNAKDFSNAILSIRRQYPKSEIVFDCAKLTYISSAGLRVLLSLSKKEKMPIKLINVSQGISDILDVTSFSTIFEVSRPVRDISSEEGHLIGESAGIVLYLMNNDTILKLYPIGTNIDEVRNELKYTKEALLSGVPALISYDIVTYKGKLGIIYEMPNVKTVSSLIIFQQWKLEQYAAEMGKTLRVINSCTPSSGVIPKTSELFKKKAIKMRKYYTNEEIEKLISIISVIPEYGTVVFGNYHPGNVFVMDDELILINMSGISCGNPIYDLGMSYMICVLEAEWLVKKITDLDMIQSKKIWDILIRNYFNTDDEDIIQNKEQIIRTAAMLCSALLPSVMNISNEDTEVLIAKARRDVFPNVDNLKTMLEGAIF